MFFNQDILFKNGPLALVWILGNEDLKERAAGYQRNENYRKAVGSNLIQICKDLRALFPTMGTVHGPGSKKMGTLLQGAVVIYSMKVAALARDAYLASKRGVPSATSTLLDMPPPRTTGKTAHKKRVDPLDNNATLANESFGGLDEVFGGDIENFGQLVGEMGVLDRGTPRRFDHEPDDHVFAASPRRTSRDSQEREEGHRPTARKKQRQEEVTEEYMREELLSKMGTVNSNAHCLREDIGLFEPSESINPEFDFGGDIALGDGLSVLIDADAGSNVPGELELAEEPPISFGPTSNLEFNNKSNVIHTPPSIAQTNAENGRVRRNANEQQADITMDLGEIENGLSARAQQKRRGVRKRLLLNVIDAETKLTREDLDHRMQTVKQNDKMENLQKELWNTQAPPKSAWKMHMARLNIRDYIKSSGRVIASAVLTGLIEDKMNGLDKEREREHRRQISNLSVSYPVGCRETTNAPDRSGDHEQPIGPIEDYVEDPPGRIDDYQIDLNVELGTGIVDDYQPDHNVEPEMEPCENANERPKSKRQSKEVRTIENKKLVTALGDARVFTDLCPPETTTRKKSAVAFFTLLKMQASKQVFLQEDEPYGQILVKKVIA